MNDRFFARPWKDADTCLKDLLGRIPKYIYTAFVSAVVFGFLVHLYIFSNKLTNHDDVGVLYQNNYGAFSGRWFTPISDRLRGGFCAPWLIGVLSVLCLAGAVCFTVSLLRIRRPVGCVLTAALMVSFPAVTATFTYMFTAFSYFFGLLLAAFGAWVSVKHGWWGSAVGAAALTLSLGSYQSYFPVAAALMVGAMLLETLDAERSFRQLMLRGLRLVATLAAALAAYMAIVRFTTRDTGLVDYMGIREMGQIKLSELPMLIKNSYVRCVAFLFHNTWHFDFLAYAFALVGVGMAALFVLLLVRRRLGPARTALAVALAAVYPLAANLICVMAPHSYAHALMVYGLCCLLLFPLFLTEFGAGILQAKSTDRMLCVAVSWVTVATMALTAYSYAVFDNGAYVKIDLGMRQCQMYSNRLISRIETCEGYQPGMDVVLVGSEVRDPALDVISQFSQIQMVGVLDMGSFRTSYSYDAFLRIYCGFSDPVYLGTSPQGVAFAATQQVQDMPCYPQQGSVQVIDGAVVVKLNG